MTGIVFDVQKFSLHDGPGIRTTVFLKGCPLSCAWCANPESQNLQPQLGYIAKNCQNCMNCLDVCPTHAHQQDNGIHSLDFELCTHCGECVPVCPHHALKMYGESMSVDQVMEQVLKDRLYYEQSGGGLTLSGGEPTLQLDFTNALLESAKSQHLHTCIETAGYTTPHTLKQLLPVVDCFLFDFKLFDDTLMLTYTGVSNDLILKNLKMLADNDATIILRCPIIPGINDLTKHFRYIAELVQSMKRISKVQVMPYHNFGRSKAAEIGCRYSINKNTADIKSAEKWVKQLIDSGCPTVERG